MKRAVFYSIVALFLCGNACFAGSCDIPRESYIVAASKTDFKTSIGFIHGISMYRGISCSRWFSDATAAQLAIGENPARGLSVDVTGIRSYKRFTFARIIGYSSLVYDSENPEYVLFGLGGGLEYYIGNLGQTITYGALANRFEIYLGARFGMSFRF